VTWTFPCNKLFDNEEGVGKMDLVPTGAGGAGGVSARPRSAVDGGGRSGRGGVGGGRHGLGRHTLEIWRAQRRRFMRAADRAAAALCPRGRPPRACMTIPRTPRLRSRFSGKRAR